MEASKKANELANKFITKSVFDMTDEELKKQREQGKAFAIICVDEILNDNPNIYDSDRLNHKYWKEVKSNPEKWFARSNGLKFCLVFCLWGSSERFTSKNYFGEACETVVLRTRGCSKPPNSRKRNQ